MSQITERLLLIIFLIMLQASVNAPVTLCRTNSTWRKQGKLCGTYFIRLSSKQSATLDDGSWLSPNITSLAPTLYMILLNSLRLLKICKISKLLAWHPKQQQDRNLRDSENTFHVPQQVDGILLRFLNIFWIYLIDNIKKIQLKVSKFALLIAKIR